MKYYSSNFDWVSMECKLRIMDEKNWAECKPFAEKIKTIEELLQNEQEFYKKPEVIYNETFASKLDLAIDELREKVSKNGHREMLERIDSKAGKGFENVQELLGYVNGEGHEYRSQYAHEITNGRAPVQAKATEKRTATFNELFGTLSAGNPIVSKYYGLQKNKELSRLKQNKDLSEADRAKRIAELEASEAAGKLYENYIQTFPINYVYPPTINEYQEMVRKAEEERKKQEEEIRKAKEKAWWDIGKQVLEAVAMVVVATLVPGGPLIVAAYVAGKMAATALNGNIDPISGEKVDGFGYATMALDAFPGLGAMGKFAKGTKVATTAGKIVSGSQRVEKVISTVAKGAKTITQFGAKALKFYDNPVTQMAITAYQTHGDPMSIAMAGAGLTGSLTGKIRNSQKLAGLITKAPKAVQAVSNTAGKMYDKVSGLGTKLNNKINAIAEKSQNAISNFFGKTKNKLGDKLSDFGMKARSLGVKYAEVPVLAMPGGGSIGRPLKIPVGVGINQTKLDNLRQMKIEQGIKAGGKLKIASPNYKPYTSDHKKVLQEFPDFDETKPFIKTVENPSSKPKYTVHAYDPGPPPMAFEKQTTGINFGLKGQSVTKSINGNDVTIKYNENGFPIFDEHALVLNDTGDTVYRNTSQEFLNMNHSQQENHLIKKMNLDQFIFDKGFTMHHSESIGEVQIVPTVVHKEFRHSGGMSLWGIGHK